MLEDVIQLHRAGRFTEAEDGYRQLLAEHPDDAEVLHLLGILRGQRGDVAGGLQLVARAADLAPDNPACQYTLGEMYLSQGRLDEAETAYEGSRRLNPNLAAAHGGLGQIAFLRGDIDNAESHFKVALRADENDVQAMVGLGRVAGARGDANAAARWLSRAVELAPDNARVQIEYAHALLDLGTLDFAATALDKALAVRPGDGLALVLRAEVHVRKGELQQAMPILKGLIARGDQQGPAHVLLGDVGSQQGRYDDAVAEYGEAMRMYPDMPHAAVRRAEALARGGHIEAAIDALHTYGASYPSDREAPVALAALLAGVDRHTDALAVWESAGKRWPDDANIKALHALELDRAGHSDAALALAQSISSSPYPAIAMLRARGALLAGDPAAAAQYLQRIDPERFDGEPPQLVRRHERLLGLAYDALEQWPDAVAAFSKAHRMTGGSLRVLPSLDPAACESLRGLAEAPALVEEQRAAPVLVCGLPGAGVGEVATLLADQPGWVVRRDRFRGAPDFLSRPVDPRLVAPLDDSELTWLARRYRRAVERAGWPSGTRVADWIPTLDARVIPAARRALPGIKLLIVERDLRDTLLNWLGFGWSEDLAMTTPLDGARWLRLAHEHLECAARLVPTLRVDPDVLLSDGGGGDVARKQLAKFVGLDTVTPGPLMDNMRALRGGLPTRFPAGHADHYREVLSEAFGVLEDD